MYEVTTRNVKPITKWLFFLQGNGMNCTPDGMAFTALTTRLQLFVIFKYLYCS